MPFCPTCKKEFPDGTELCPVDQQPLNDELPYQVIEGEDGTWVEISSAATEDEARILQGFLETEGIPCRVESLRFHMEPVNFGKLGEIRVYVRVEDQVRATALMNEKQAAYDALPEEGETIGELDMADAETVSSESDEP
ncbi:MAG: hypothetical protein ABI718_05180 [Acidobacteriota bacterium]